MLKSTFFKLKIVYNIIDLDVLNMNTLFISTYSYLITIGLIKNDKTLAIKKVESIKSHSKYLIPTIDSILKENNLELSNINEIVVIIGPGSFTGVRLGVIVAKTLAYSLKIKIKTITSIEALAVSNDVLERKIVTVSDNKGVYYAFFENNEPKTEIKYLSKTEFENIKSKDIIINDNVLNLEKITIYLKNKAFTNSHEVKPIYIKEIEALK